MEVPQAFKNAGFERLLSVPSQILPQDIFLRVFICSGMCSLLNLSSLT
jgi:hypothetical protein